MTANSALSAGPDSVRWMPYQVITAKMIQVEPAPPTASRGRISAAEMRLSAIRNRRRRTRSATAPASGPARVGAYTHTDTRAAALLLPVSDFIQMPAASDMALLPITETARPVRYSRPLRRSAPPPAAAGAPP
jgi:hypothetical protein